MTPPPANAPDDSSLPQRHRPNVDDLSKDTTERDLWDLDELVMEDVDPPPPTLIEPIRRGGLPSGPEPRPSPTKSPDAVPSSTVPVLDPRPSVIRRVSKATRPRAPLTGPTPGTPKPRLDSSGPGTTNRMESTFDDLEQWDVPAEQPPAPAAIEEEFSDLSAEPAHPNPAPAAPAEPVAVPQPDPPPEPAAAPAATNASDNEFEVIAAPQSAPATLVPKFHLSLLEKAGLALLALLLAAGAVVAYRNTFSRMNNSGASHTTELPVTGANVSLIKVESYWRPPITTGDQVEIVQRGVVLIPVAEITVSGKGAVRVLFSNDQDSDVGDPMIRQVDGETTLVIASTAGFEDTAMHEAYRAGLTPDWHLKIAEAPTSNTSGSSFRELAELPINPNLK